MNMVMCILYDFPVFPTFISHGLFMKNGIPDIYGKRNSRIKLKMKYMP